MLSWLQVNIVFFFFSVPSRQRRIRFCDDILSLLISSFAIFVNVLCVLGLPAARFPGCGMMFATRFRLFELGFFFSASIFFMTSMSLWATGVGFLGGGGGRLWSSGVGERC